MKDCAPFLIAMGWAIFPLSAIIIWGILAYLIVGEIYGVYFKTKSEKSFSLLKFTASPQLSFPLHGKNPSWSSAEKSFSTPYPSTDFWGC